MSNFDMLLVAHLIGDYLLQTNWMALNKSKKWLPLIIHSLVYTAVVWMVSLIGFQGLSWEACIFIFASHLVLDRRTLVNWWTGKIMGVKQQGSLWLVIIADQTFHLIVLALALQI